MKNWNDIRFPAHDERVWELYHENSKTPRYATDKMDDEDVQQILDTLHISLPTQAVGTVALDVDDNTGVQVVSTEIPASGESASLTFRQLSAVLQFAEGQQLHKEIALHAFLPLEVYGISLDVQGLPKALFHVDRKNGRIEFIHEELDESTILSLLPGTEGAAVYLFISGLFQRSALLFGEKGYRFAVTESGRMAQNILLAASALGIYARMEIQYCERDVESLIGIDGVEHALLQVISVATHAR